MFDTQIRLDWRQGVPQKYLINSLRNYRLSQRHPSSIISLQPTRHARQGFWTRRCDVCDLVHAYKLDADHAGDFSVCSFTLDSQDVCDSS